MNKLHRKAKRKIEKEFKNYKKFNLKYASKAEIWDICHRKAELANHYKNNNYKINRFVRRLPCEAV